MRIYKLFVILSVIFLGNAIFIFILFYYNPPYQKLDIDIATDMGMSWDANGYQLAYYSKKDNGAVIDEYNFNARTVQTIFSQPDIDTSSSLGFSPDNKYISYFKQNNSRKSIDIIDINNKKSATKEVFSEKQDLLLSDNGGPKNAVAWLDNRHIIYENSVPFERIGLVLVDIISGEEEKFIPYGIRPSLSLDKKYLAYAITDQGQNQTLSIYKINLETNQTDVVAEKIGFYVYNLSWSPDGSLIAVSYLDKTNNTLNRVAILDNNGSVVSDNLMESSSPKWLDNNNLLLTKFQSVGSIISSKMITGLYLYNIKNNTIHKITQRVRSENYYLRPNTYQVVYQFNNNVELIDINRILAPKGIDALRNKFGIIAK